MDRQRDDRVCADKGPWFLVLDAYRNRGSNKSPDSTMYVNCDSQTVTPSANTPPSRSRIKGELEASSADSIFDGNDPHSPEPQHFEHRCCWF